MNLLDILLIILSLSSCLRLLFYRRGISVFKVGYSVIAYLLIVSSGALGLAILTGILQGETIPTVIILLIKTTAIAILYSGGNVARLLKLPGRIKHAINFR